MRFDPLSALVGFTAGSALTGTVALVVMEITIQSALARRTHQDREVPSPVKQSNEQTYGSK